uniref:MADF domain-containing protein n=1 Tax=Ditylenchus dipsaci TaxID=166011 RepID=A0A915E2R9_9BILA
MISQSLPDHCSAMLLSNYCVCLNFYVKIEKSRKEEIKSPGKAVDLNDKEKSILAEVVKKRSAIWDAKDPDYKKKAVENWMDVADEFEQRSGSKYAHQDLQKAWKSITTYHNTVKNKVKSASGVAAKDASSTCNLIKRPVVEPEAKSCMKRARIEEDDVIGKEILQGIKQMNSDSSLIKYKHAVSRELDELMDKLTNQGEQRMKVELRFKVQQAMNDVEIKLLEKGRC